MHLAPLLVLLCAVALCASTLSSPQKFSFGPGAVIYDVAVTGEALYALVYSGSTTNLVQLDPTALQTINTLVVSETKVGSGFLITDLDDIIVATYPLTATGATNFSVVTQNTMQPKCSTFLPQVVVPFQNYPSAFVTQDSVWVIDPAVATSSRDKYFELDTITCSFSSLPVAMGLSKLIPLWFLSDPWDNGVIFSMGTIPQGSSVVGQLSKLNFATNPQVVVKNGDTYVSNNPLGMFYVSRGVRRRFVVPDQDGSVYEFNGTLHHVATWPLRIPADEKLSITTSTEAALYGVTTGNPKGSVLYQYKTVGFPYAFTQIASTILDNPAAGVWASSLFVFVQEGTNLLTRFVTS